MRAKHLLIVAAVILVLGFLIYRWRSTKDQLQVEPHARQQIEKAKRR